MGIEFPLERARRAMGPLQIQPSLFEDSGRQIFPGRLEMLIVGTFMPFQFGSIFLRQAFEALDFREFQIFCAGANVVATVLCRRDPAPRQSEAAPAISLDAAGANP